MRQQLSAAICESSADARSPRHNALTAHAVVQGLPAAAADSQERGCVQVHRRQLTPAAVEDPGGAQPGQAGLEHGGKGVCAVRRLPGAHQVSPKREYVRQSISQSVNQSGS